VHVVHRDPAGLEERRADHEPVRLAPALPERFCERVGLGRIVAPQGGVAAAHDVEVRPRPGGLQEVKSDHLVQGDGFSLREAAGVGEDVEGGARLFERPAQVLDRPGSEDRHAVHTLDTGRVVVEDDHALAALQHAAPDLLQGPLDVQLGRL
jgi:hypothetical protein